MTLYNLDILYNKIVKIDKKLLTINKLFNKTIFLFKSLNKIIQIILIFILSFLLFLK